MAELIPVKYRKCLKSRENMSFFTYKHREIYLKKTLFMHLAVHIVAKYIHGVAL